MVRPPTKSQFRAALWAVRARRFVGRQLRRVNADTLTLPAAPTLGLDATRGVNGVLKLSRATCLERSMVLQRWYADQGLARDVVIGVTSPRAGFRAHAWLEAPADCGEPTGPVDPNKPHDCEFSEITRIPSSVAARTPVEGHLR
jgi:hypothetical protein